MTHRLQPCRGRCHPRKREIGRDAVIGAYTQRLASSQYVRTRVRGWTEIGTAQTLDEVRVGECPFGAKKMDFKPHR